MRTIRDFHHYRAHEIPSDDRISRLELRVVDLLQSSTLTESERDSSVAFELKHSSATTQLARLLAHKRHLQEEACAAGALLHDIYVIVQGKYKDHARLGEPIACELLKDAGFGNPTENKKIIDIIVNHSDKHLFSDDPYIEFGKDADVLDCFLYPNAVEYYLRHKPLSHMFHYLSRAKTIWSDLGISSFPNYLTLLDSYEPNWLAETDRCDPSWITRLFSAGEIGGAPNFLLRIDDGIVTISFNKREAVVKASPNRGSIHTQSQRSTPDILQDFFKRYGLSLDDCHGVMIWSSVGIIEPIPRTSSGLNRIRELTGQDSHADPQARIAI
jgi:hypothetical protein